VGVVQTGPNDHCGAPVWTLSGLPAGPESSGTFLGLRDSTIGATEAIPLTPSACAIGSGLPGALLATTYDDDFGTFRGWPVPNVQLENRTLRRVPVNVGNGLSAPIPDPGTVPPNPLPPTITQPTDLITLGTWLAAAGDLEIVCDDAEGSASIAAKMSNLIPHGVYTMWGQWVDPGDGLLTVPIGGLPNTIVADAAGDAEFCREVEFCPLDLAPNSSELQFLSAIFMGSTETFGAVPYEPFATRAFIGLGGLPFVSTIPGGIISFDQIGFRINATGGPDPGPTSPVMCAAPPVGLASITPEGVAAVFVLLAFGGIVLARRTSET
jgi:hypothetical protein